MPSHFTARVYSSAIALQMFNQAMTNLATNAEQSQDEIGIISKADRYALLKMLEDKPRVIIQNALQDAARRGLFTDKMLDRVPTKSGTGRVLKSTMFVCLLLLAGAFVYVGSRDRTTFLTASKEPKSLMGITPDDMATAATKVGDEKYEIIYSRLSEPVRNVFKNHLPEPDGESQSKTRGNINCPPDAKQRDFTAKASQRNAEPANKWIERMTVINKTGKTNELQTELKKFRQAYPSIVLPPALQALAC
jgi:hypothetical protein